MNTKASKINTSFGYGHILILRTIKRTNNNIKELFQEEITNCESKINNNKRRMETK